MDDLQTELENVLICAGLGAGEIQPAVERIGALLATSDHGANTHTGHAALAAAGLDADAMTSLVMQLTDVFENSATYDPVAQPFWVSDSGRTTVTRRGCCLDSSPAFEQKADDRFAEYVVLFNQREVFSFTDYMWPDMAPEESGTNGIPFVCVGELLEFHRIGETWWYRTWQAQLADQATANASEQSAGANTLSQLHSEDSFTPRRGAA